MALFCFHGKDGYVNVPQCYVTRISVAYLFLNNVNR